MQNARITLQVRMQATGVQTKCDNMLCSFVKIYKTEGVAGLWRVSVVLSVSVLLDGSDFGVVFRVGRVLAIACSVDLIDV